MSKITKDWKKELTPQQYRVLREKVTDTPFTGDYLDMKEDGMYSCAACGTELFSSETKFDSGSGWPSFYDVATSESVELKEDDSHGMQRIEVVCKNCGGHLGHLFDDGPADKTGKRYCINSSALEFSRKAGSRTNVNSSGQKMNTLVVAGGCFWCTEAVFQRLKGVTLVEPGYTGGTTNEPTYEEICSGKTGHAESIRITYNPEIITLNDLLEVFFHLHDPTTLNRQGNDSGPQYRSAIFYENEEDKKIFEDKIQALQTADLYHGRKIVTTLEPLSNFYLADPSHRDYYNKNSYQPYCSIVINPKIKKLYDEFPAQVKDKS